ncbi:MAG TPA: thioredoxin-like domain-containing protein [Candidatus Acidoferrales bacterium]|nr:thioredoxin-like domain-containing protein [Candidatus Acidoferrales bacterium]
MKRLGLVGLLVLLCGFAPGSALLNLNGGLRWINSPALQSEQLRGKVVLVDFWEYTCLNCLRTLPYLREWYKRYRGDGFVIIGVHSPEFGFSSQPEQVEAATKRLNITWPVVVDTAGHTIWTRFGVNVWPTELLYDQDGHLVDVAAGEGNYQHTEAKIQELLRAANPSLALPSVMALLPQDNYDKPGAVCYPHTPELLVGRTHIADAPVFGDGSSGDVAYHDRGNHRDGSIYLDGFWHPTGEAIAFGGGNGYFDLPYRAIEVTAVLTADRGPTRVNVTQDGKPVAREDAGSDIHYDGTTSYLDVDASRSYHVIENAVYGAHDLRLSPKGYGLAVYDVDFESCEVPGTR